MKYQFMINKDYKSMHNTDFTLKYRNVFLLNSLNWIFCAYHREAYHATLDALKLFIHILSPMFQRINDGGVLVLEHARHL